MVVEVTVCATLTVPVHEPVVQGLGEMDTMNVPAVTPVPAINIPTSSEPVVKAEIESAVEAAETDPVNTAATPLQKKPAGQGDSAPTPGAQNFPDAHSVGRPAPAAQNDPAGHAICEAPPVVVGQ